MSKASKRIEQLTQELRRGVVTMVVLAQLKEAQYGYSLVEILQSKGIEIEAGTLYPLLRRLEKQELLESKWDTTEGRPRKYYILSDLGEITLDLLHDEWEELSKNVNILMKG